MQKSGKTYRTALAEKEFHSPPKQQQKQTYSPYQQPLEPKSSTDRQSAELGDPAYIARQSFDYSKPSMNFRSNNISPKYMESSQASLIDQVTPHTFLSSPLLLSCNSWET